MQDINPLDALSDILDDVPDPVFVYSVEGRYLYINRAASVFLGSDPLDVIGNHWHDLGYPPEIMEPLMSRASQVANDCAAARIRITTSPARGSRVLDMSMSPLRCDGGEAIAVLAIAHDVTESV